MLRQPAAKNRSSRKEILAAVFRMENTMLALNIEFQEEYKRLDRLCKDYLSSTEGVSEYIRQMETAQMRNRYRVADWDFDYKQLKHIRWLRNRLAHEVGTLDSDICTEDDLEWVKNFYGRIINGADPFSVVRKAKEAERRRLAQQRKAERQMQAEENNDSPAYSNQPKNKKSFFKRIIDGVKSLFR